MIKSFWSKTKHHLRGFKTSPWGGQILNGCLHEHLVLASARAHLPTRCLAAPTALRASRRQHPASFRSGYVGCNHHRQLGNYFDSSSVNDEEMERDFNASFEKEMKMSGAKASSLVSRKPTQRLITKLVLNR